MVDEQPPRPGVFCCRQTAKLPEEPLFLLLGPYTLPGPVLLQGHRGQVMLEGEVPGCIGKLPVGAEEDQVPQTPPICFRGEQIAQGRVKPCPELPQPRSGSEGVDGGERAEAIHEDPGLAAIRDLRVPEGTGGDTARRDTPVPHRHRIPRKVHEPHDTGRYRQKSACFGPARKIFKLLGSRVRFAYANFGVSSGSVTGTADPPRHRPNRGERNLLGDKATLTSETETGTSGLEAEAQLTGVRSVPGPTRSFMHMSRAGRFGNTLQKDRQTEGCSRNSLTRDNALLNMEAPQVKSSSLHTQEVWALPDRSAPAKNT
jgi:hypothetical protein